DVLASAEPSDRVIVPFDRLRVLSEQVWSKRQFHSRACFAVLNLHIAQGLDVGILRVADVHHKRLEPTISQHVYALFETMRVVEIAEQYSQARSLVLSDEASKPLTEVGRAARLKLLQEPQ